MRLDAFLATREDLRLSRARVAGLIKKGAVLLNGAECKPASKVRVGDVVSMVIPPLEEPRVSPEPIPVEIVYEDDDVLVVNKPRGMVTHPGAGVSSGTLVNALLFHASGLSGIGGVTRPGIVHRLDKNTSGLLVV
ncbi:MAG TPA: RluA family pseudouridine synthase, partial [Clostridia bacterium]|nr:RluA family pseudouridine synthase [Clostridia bacterium]